MTLWEILTSVVAAFFITTTIVAHRLYRRQRALTENYAMELKTTKTTLGRYSHIIDRYVVMTQVNADGMFNYISGAYTRLSGYREDELKGQSPLFIRHPDMPMETYEEMGQAIASGKTFKSDFLCVSKSGTPFWVETFAEPVFDENGQADGCFAIKYDVTDKKHIEKISKTDQLTGLCNRVQLDNSLNDEIQRYRRYGTEFSVILCDVDYFKSINDVHGHIVGDQVLIELANILRNGCRSTDIVGRWGGEEFLIICPQTSLENALKVAEKIRASIEAHRFSGAGFRTASFGAAAIGAEKTANELIDQADNALYAAKKGGRNAVNAYAA